MFQHVADGIPHHPRCNKFFQDHRINDFFTLLKLSCLTCQHFITSGEESLPVLGGLSREIAQESYNCISASVILCVDECYHVVSRGKYEIDTLGGTLFDVLLHLLASPQSSVTHLRTLGSKLSLLGY